MNNLNLFNLSICVIILLIIYIIYIKCKNNNKYKCNMNNKFNIRKTCEYLMPTTIDNILKEIKCLNKQLYMPCTYDNLDLEYNNFPVDKDGIYFLLDGSNILIAKQYLYNVVLNEIGLEKTLKLFPKTWTIATDKEKFINEYDPDKIYILKKNIQRQQGLTIFNNKDEILKNFISEGAYPNVIVQELLQDPYLINGRKINLRVYVLCVKSTDKFSIYVYNDGFMYYTADKFKYNSLDPKVNITTGYVDRQVYQENPLTHNDFREYLIKIHDKKTSELIFTNMYQTIKDVFEIFMPKIGNAPKLYSNLKFQLFGVDIAIDDQYNSKIMEVNKGPDLGGKDERDTLLKHNLVRNIFNIVELSKFDIKDNFILI